MIFDGFGKGVNLVSTLIQESPERSARKEQVVSGLGILEMLCNWARDDATRGCSNQTV